MGAILASGLASAAGAAIVWGVGWLRGNNEVGRVLRRAVTEIVVAGAAGAWTVAVGMEDLSKSVLVWCFCGGVVWSLLCEVCRVFATRLVRRACADLGPWLLSTNRRRWPRTVLRHARDWPSIFWHEMVHAAGLSDVTDAEMHAYEVYRSQVAWSTRFLHQRHHWAITKWVWHLELPMLLVAIAGNVLYLCVQPAYTALVQAAVVFLFLVGMRDPVIDPNNRDDAEAARLFHRCWCALLASWVVLYLMLFWTKMVPTDPPEGLKDPPFGFRAVVYQYLNNLNSCFLLFSYFVLRDPPALGENRFGRSSGWAELEWKAAGLGAALAMLTMADAYWTWQGLHGQVHYFQWIGGAAGGVALALLIGRLESKAIGAPIGVVALLYFYAVLQGALIGSRESHAAETLMYLLALALKSLLVLFLTWVLASGRLALYFQRMRSLAAERRATDERIEEAILESD